MNFGEIKRITKELEGKQKKISKLDEQKESLQLEIMELEENMKKAMVGDISYKEME